MPGSGLGSASNLPHPEERAKDKVIEGLKSQGKDFVLA